MTSEQSDQALITLMDCLNRENHLLGFLLDACEEQMEALKTGNHTAVDTAVGKAVHLINGLNAIEAERLQNKTYLDAALGLHQDSVLSDLLPYLGHEKWHQVSGLQQEMQTKAERLRAVNEVNSIMTKQILDFNEAMINILNPKEDLTYGASGSRQGIANQRRDLLNKTV
jgi:flagellar biosynthesis/type III secretory pathway chaperone